MSDKWLTVTQAAQELGISERQARRYAARLSPEDRDDGTDAAPDSNSDEAGQDSLPRPARRATRVRLEAMRAARDEATGRENIQSTLEKEPDTVEAHAGQAADTSSKEPDLGPDVHSAGTGHISSAPTDWEERAAEYKEQIQFLRAMVEQHQRSEAELRASLREALKAMPRQLTSGEPSSTKDTAPTETPTSTPLISTPPPATPKAPRETPRNQKRRAVRELLRAFLGIKGDNE